MMKKVIPSVRPKGLELTLDDYKKLAEKYEEGKTYRIKWSRDYSLIDGKKNTYYARAVLVRKYPYFVEFRESRMGLEHGFLYQDLPDIILD